MDLQNIQQWSPVNGVTAWSMYMKCPVCFERGRNTEAALWVHGDDCMGDVYLGDNAYWYCKKCGRSGPLSELQYKCPTHSKDADDEYVGITGGATTIATMISTAGMLTTKAGTKWLREFLKNLETLTW